jgi:16S rRNA (guanine527-N7)-methyltransferase
MAEQSHYKNRLHAAAAKLEIDLADSQADALLAYIEQLQRWNRTYNLTAIRDPSEMLVHHVFDSLSIVPYVTAILDKNTVENVNVVDVGSGAGLPGVILAIMRPQWRLFCIDAVEKKMAFVRQVAGVLGLSRLRAMHERVEAIEPLQADIVVSRAFASLLDFANLAGRHVAPGGQLLAMKGHEPLQEAEALEKQTDWKISRIEPLYVPELNAQRCLVWMSRQGTL